MCSLSKNPETVTSITLFLFHMKMDGDQRHTKLHNYINQMKTQR
jgi:hypothetical protein